MHGKRKHEHTTLKHATHKHRAQTQSTYLINLFKEKIIRPEESTLGDALEDFDFAALLNFRLRLDILFFDLVGLFDLLFGSPLLFRPPSFRRLLLALRWRFKSWLLLLGRFLLVCGCVACVCVACVYVAHTCAVAARLVREVLRIRAVAIAAIAVGLRGVGRVVLAFQPAASPALFRL
jgi:hypothetical protein